MPSLSSVSPIFIDDLGVSVPFAGLILLKSGSATGMSGLSGIGAVRNIALTVEQGLMTKAHLCDQSSALFELPNPVQLEPSSPTLKYLVGWLAGDSKRLRADLGPSAAFERVPRTVVTIPSQSVLDVASLYAFRVV